MGNVQYRWDTLVNVGDILSTVEDIQYHGGEIWQFVQEVDYLMFEFR